MMSPLALLNEGETGEIVERAAGLDHAHPHHHGHGHTHRHGGHADCCGGCKTCSSHGTKHQASDHLMNMGLRPGKQVEMLSNRGAGPLVLRVDECRIAVARGAAMKIYVRRIEG